MIRVFKYSRLYICDLYIYTAHNKIINYLKTFDSIDI